MVQLVLPGVTLKIRDSGSTVPLAQIISTGMLIVALVALYFTRQQRKTEKAKLRLDAFPKRIEIFRCTERFVSRSWADQNAYMPAVLAEFYNCKKEPVFRSTRRWPIISTTCTKALSAISI